jgi:hypothetical protein
MFTPSGLGSIRLYYTVNERIRTFRTVIMLTAELIEQKKIVNQRSESSRTTEPFRAKVFSAASASPKETTPTRADRTV